MLDGKGSEMRVRHQVTDGLTARQHLLKNHPMPLGRLHHSRTGLVEPTLYPAQYLNQREGMSEDPRIGPDPNEQ